MDWMKIITDSGNIFLGSILFISLTIIGVYLYLLSKYNRVGDARFDVFYIEDGTFIINSLWKPTFSLDDIERVEVGYAPYHRHGRPYIGFLRIVYPNGNRSCRYYFDISVVTRKVFNFKYHQDDIFPSSTIRFRKRGDSLYFIRIRIFRMERINCWKHEEPIPI